MKSGLLVSGVVLLLAVWAGSAEARGYRGHHGGHFGGHHGSHFGGHFGGHRSHFSFNLGAPLFWGSRYYYSPYYYTPAPAFIRQEPQVYIQREPAVTTSPPQSAPLWYYCPQPAGYYPYVQNCTQNWVGVDPKTVAPPPP